MNTKNKPQNPPNTPKTPKKMAHGFEKLLSKVIALVVAIGVDDTIYLHIMCGDVDVIKIL